MHAELACPAHPGSAGLTASVRPSRIAWFAAVGSAVLAGGAAVAGVAVAFGPIPLIWPHALDGPLRLAVAALIGVAVTAVQRRGERTGQAHAMHSAQILLCVSGAMMMVLINDSLARAFGIAGAAGLVRF